MFSRLFKALPFRSRCQVSPSTTQSSRLLRLEPLEVRDLLSVSEIFATSSALVAEYAPNNPQETAPIPLETLAAETGSDLDPSGAPVLIAANSLTPLEKPVLTVTGTTGLSITVSWDEIPNVERYSLSYKPSNETTWKGVNVGTNLSYTVGGLKLDSDYDFRVKAIGDGVNYKSVYSAVVSARTNATPDPSETPVRLETPVPTVTGTTGLSITVSWDAVPNAERYSFSYKPSNETTWKNVNVGTDLSHTVSGLKLDSDYDFRVKAIGDGQIFKSVYSTVVSAKTNAEPDPSEKPIPLDTPVLTVAAVGSTSLTINWTEVPNASRYSLFYKPVNKTTWTIVNAGTNLSYTITDLKLNAEYDARLKAIGDGVDFRSAYSPIVRVETASVHFQLDAGAVVNNQTLELYAPEGYEIYYTTDGSDPVVSPENLYSNPLTLTANASRFAADSNLINVGNYRIYDNSSLPKAVTVKAVAVTPNGDATPIATRTYFFQEKESIAVVSISTDYDNLLDYDTGIMVKGAYYDAWSQTPEAAPIIANEEWWFFKGNYTQKGKEWERSATIEIFDGDNYVVENCGIRLRGRMSRMYAQKPFNIYFRNDYGAKELDYALFDDATSIDGDVLSSYKNFMLRNGGNDTECLKFHDALIQSLVKDLNFTTQANRPAVLYLNGEYMGVFVMQEKFSDRFFADHYLVAKNNVVVIEEGVVEEGDDDDIALYEELQSYANMDMTDPEVYGAFCNAVDVESMIDYYATQIYIANADWKPDTNVRLWRVRTPENDSYGDGKWRWVLNDTEYSSSLYGVPETRSDYNSLSVALDVDPLFASVMKNADFCQAFAEKIESLAVNNFSSAKVNSALNYFSSVYKPYMSNYYKRFGDTSLYWNLNISEIRNFFANRFSYISEYVEDYWDSQFTEPVVVDPDSELTFSLEAGAIVSNQTLELYAPEGYEIYYTTDGSDPVVSPNNLYSEPLALTANASRFAANSNLINISNYNIYDNSALPKAVTVKAVAAAPDGSVSPIATRTYFFQEKESVVVVSISTDYDNLLDYDTGIMVKGAYYDAWINTPEAASVIANKEWWDYEGNYTQKGGDWERSATIEIFDGDNYVVENGGIRLHGDTSRMYAQKPFSVYFRNDYGAEELDYALFEDATSIDGDVLSSYKNFVLRNGGNDAEYLKFHDALIQSLVKDLDVTTQASRPAVLYLNGEYMGVFVLQEKYSDQFFADHYLVDKDAVVVIDEGAVDEGVVEDIALYEELQSYAETDMSDPEVYRAFCDVVDVESMIDYYATQIYIANADWDPEKNSCLWRVRTPENDSYGDGKWRWVLYDTEFSSSLYGSSRTASDYDSFTVALDADPLFASVMKNADFCQAFVEKIASLAVNNFSSAKVNSALDRFSSVYRPYMSNYYKRFGDTSAYWNVNVNGIRNFFANRSSYISNYVENYQLSQFAEPVVVDPDTEVTFSLEAGAIVETQTLELSAPEGYEIYYTTDGSDPVVSPNNLYSEPLALTANASRFAADSDLINVGNYRIYDNDELPKAVTVKAIAAAPDGAVSPIATRTYFFQEREPIAVISISTDYDNLLDYNTGIMVKGACYDAWVGSPEAESAIANGYTFAYEGNYTQKGKDWERPATIEIFDGEDYVVENGGIRIRGGASRMYAQKSFNIYFRKEYGAKNLDYPLFEDAESVDGDVLSSYKSFMLRNGGNDTQYLKFRDALIQSLVKDLDVTTQAGRPAVLYLNGEYMGVYVMQEKFSDRFFADRYLVDKDNVVIVEDGVIEEGQDSDVALYDQLASYAERNLADPNVYNEFCNVVDIQSMIDYYATQIYIGNADWNHWNNTRLWRVRTPENDSYGDGRWRWILYDTEYSAALYHNKNALYDTSYDYDSFTAAVDKDPIFAKLITNADFYQAFVDRIESLAENNFSPTNVDSALASFTEIYQPYMANYYKRFGDTSSRWDASVNAMSEYFANRYQYISTYIENYRP